MSSLWFLSLKGWICYWKTPKNDVMPEFSTLWCHSIDGLSFIYGVTNKLILVSRFKNKVQLNDTTKRPSLRVAKNRPLVVTISPASPFSPLLIECSLTLFLSLALHFIFSCLIKSYQIEIYRISMTRQPVLRLPNKGPFCGKKSNHSNNNNDNDDKDTIMVLLSSTIIFVSC